MLILKSESMYLHNIFLKVSDFKPESAPNVKPCPSNFLKKITDPVSFLPLPIPQQFPSCRFPPHR